MLGRKLAPFRFRDQPPFGDADQCIVCLEILAPAVERLVGRDQRDAVRIGKIEQPRLDLFLLGPPVALQLDVEPVAKQRGEAPAARCRQIRLTRNARERDLLTARARAAGAPP